MAARECPICGLKSPSRSERCDCGYRFRAPSAARQTCPECECEWASTVLRCSCGTWLDPDACEMSEKLTSKQAKGWVFLASGLLLVAPALMIGWWIQLWVASFILIGVGGRSVAQSRRGLRLLAPPRRVKPPQARLLKRPSGA
jgi:hypothetical protein